MEYGEKYKWVKVNINIEKPLVKGTCVHRPRGTETWIEFRYERILNFYYRCGKINHTIKSF